MHAFIEILMILFNLGLTLSLIFRGMILAQPVTNRFLRPRQRAILWYLGWYSMLVFAGFGALGYLPLHFTFRSFLSARTYLRSYPLPAFVPDCYDGPGRYNLSLPGNTAVSVVLTDHLMTAAFVVWVVGAIAVWLWVRGQGKKLRALERAGEEVSLAQLGVDDPKLKTAYFEKIGIKIYLCGGLPTSYVRNGFWAKDYFIYLQRELTPQRLALVLRHELKHIQLNHVLYKSIAHMALVLYWWSPLVWLAFRVLCRDMELDCDEALMDELDENSRREYARTIAELGAGRPLWESAATFGECDAQVRVRRAVSWKRAAPRTRALSWAAFALLFVFFYCGSPAGGGTLDADQALVWEQLLSQDVTELVNVGSGTPCLNLTEVWTDPDSADVYGLDTRGGWWRFALKYFPRSREYLAVDSLRLGGAPDLSGLERVK